MYWSLASLFMNSHKDCCRRIAEQVGKPAQITHLFGTPHSNAAMLNTRLNRLVAVKKITESSSTAVAYTITRVPTGMWSDSSIQLPCLSPQLPSQLKEVGGVRAATLRKLVYAPRACLFSDRRGRSLPRSSLPIAGSGLSEGGNVRARGRRVDYTL